MEHSRHILHAAPLRFSVTASQPCAYLENQIEQRLATNISPNPDQHDRLAETGFRRIENWVYRPICSNCNACQPIRVNCKIFTPSRNHKRIDKQNAGLVRSVHYGKPSLAHYHLFQHYLHSRHQNGEMASMNIDEFITMIDTSPIDSFLLQYHDRDDTLLACMLVDKQRDGLSAVYSFFQPQLAKRSLGSYMILELITIAKEADLPYLYLGYYIQSSQKMAYKARFKPYELFIDGRWQISG